MKTNNKRSYDTLTHVNAREEILKLSHTLKFLNTILQDCENSLVFKKEGDYNFTFISNKREDTLRKIKAYEKLLDSAKRRLAYLNKNKLS